MSTSSQPWSFVPASVTVRRQWLTPSFPVGWQQAARMRTGLRLADACLLYATRQVVPKLEHDVGRPEDAGVLAGVLATVETLEPFGGVEEWLFLVARTITATTIATATQATSTTIHRGPWTPALTAPW